MPLYHQLGDIPHKRHTQFRDEEGNLYREELKSTYGFNNITSLLYHIHAPTVSTKVEGEVLPEPEAWDEKIRHHHLRTEDIPVHGDITSGRIPLMFNQDVTISVCRPEQSMDDFYRNGDCDEVIFVHDGSGELKSPYGKLEFHKGDYIVIPRGITYNMSLNSDNSRFLIFESQWPIKTPKRYRNEHGQLLEHSPFCERDLRRPKYMEPRVETGEFHIRVKARNRITTFVLDHHPFDVVGWDGYFYPWIFNIDDFEPITGRIHQPPPVHQTFETEQFVICSFVPRLFDYHPKSIPAPYFHHNVDSDEIIYYVEGDFMSREGVERSSITYHPGNVPHGPQPGKTEASIGKERTDELAVMLDTFRPLYLTKQSQELDDPDYPYSWVD